MTLLSERGRKKLMQTKLAGLVHRKGCFAAKNHLSRGVSRKKVCQIEGRVRAAPEDSRPAG
jgi:hypothetical protein